ncbi:MAG: hypothetical protein V7647_2773 [Acidobacteriota bacterium]|jgi:hypothetical protein
MDHKLKLNSPLIAAVFVLGSAAGAAAQTPADIWSAAGVTGSIDEADLSMHQFNSTGSVSIKSSVAGGTLDIRFPVQTMTNHLAPAGACTELRAVLRDTGAGARVIVSLMQLGIRSGFEGQLTRLGQIDSDTTPRLTALNQPDQYAAYRTCLKVPTEPPFDFASYTYYVEAQLIKTSSSANPGLMSVQICHTDEQCEP